MKNKIIIIILVLILIAVGYFIYSDLGINQEIKNTDSVIVEKDGIQYEFVEPEIENLIDIPVPDLSKFVPINAKEIVKRITNGEDKFVLWNDLAIYYQLAKDYTKTEEIWSYTAQKWPKKWLSFLNIANLQAYYLKDAIKAENNYLKVIEINPNNSMIYIRIYEFYRDILKNNQKAIEIIELGIKNNPNDQLLKDFLSEI